MRKPEGCPLPVPASLTSYAGQVALPARHSPRGDGWAEHESPDKRRLGRVINDVHGFDTFAAQTLTTNGIEAFEFLITLKSAIGRFIYVAAQGNS